MSTFGTPQAASGEHVQIVLFHFCKFKTCKCPLVEVTESESIARRACVAVLLCTMQTPMQLRVSKETCECPGTSTMPER